jgi:hypothetical protein
MPTVRAAAIVCLCLITGLACKAKPAKPAGFADDALMSSDKSLPFHKAWHKPGHDGSKYKLLYVAPVNTSYMLQTTDWQKGERKDQITKDVGRLGEYAQNAMKKAFRADKNKRFTVVDDRPNTPDALIFEMALIEVVPSKVTLNALGYAPFFVGTALTVVRGLANDVSSTAFEARVRDAATGEIVAMYADREQQQTAPISVRGLTWYSHAEVAISQWAAQFVQLANRRDGQRIKDSDPFTLMPW